MIELIVQIRTQDFNAKNKTNAIAKLFKFYYQIIITIKLLKYYYQFFDSIGIVIKTSYIK